MNDKLKIIAEYDGWVDSGRKHISLDYGNIYTKKGKYTKRREMFFSEFPYLTSLDWIHPVAMKVLDGLRNVQDEQKSYYISSIRAHCSTSPINGEYIDSFNATVEGIIYLQNHSK